MKLRHHTTLAPPNESATLLSASAGPMNVAAALWSDASGWIVTHCDGKQTTVVVRLSEHPAAPKGWAEPAIQPLPDGRTAIVLRGSADMGEAQNPNAFVFDELGNVAISAYTGTDIRILKATLGGDLWIGYGDQGIYHAMAHKSRPLDATQFGIARFNSDLQLAQHYRGDNASHVIDHCYDINVAGTAVFGYFYDSFSLAEIGPDSNQYWEPQISGARSVLLNGDDIAFIGGHDQKSRPAGLRRGRLNGQNFELIESSPFWMPDEKGIYSQNHFASHGPELHVFQGPDWYRASLV